MRAIVPRVAQGSRLLFAEWASPDAGGDGVPGLHCESAPIGSKANGGAKEGVETASRVKPKFQRWRCRTESVPTAGCRVGWYRQGSANGLRGTGRAGHRGDG